jgi:hypothetical protein
MLAFLFLFYGVLGAQEDSTQIDKKEPLTITERPDTLFKTDTLATDTTKQIEKIKVVRRRFKYREQVGTALGMMAFIAIILTTVQSWNPE